MLLLSALITTYIIENTLLRQKVNQSIEDVYEYSVNLSNDMNNKDAETLYKSTVAAGKEYGCRVLIVNTGGVVIVDSYSTMNGVKLNAREVLEVLTGISDTSYGYHRIESEGKSPFWSAYYVSSIIYGSETIGAVVFSQSLEDVTSGTRSVTQQLTVFFILSLVLVGSLSYFLTSHVTKPIDDLKDAAAKVGRGNFSVRVVPSGSKELVELAKVFNSMTDHIQNIDKQRSEFISNASHELKTPITSMKILAESLLSEDNVPPEIYKEFLTDINAEMDRLNNLVKDLLLLTKLEDAKATLTFEDADITEMCSRAVRMLSPLAEKKNIELKYVYEEYVEANCSKSTIYEAISNLVENAIKYAKDGGKVTIRARYFKGKFVDVSIEDTGEGISEEDQEHLFERFYRVDKARSRATGGTGLGLHIVKQIAKAHGGTVFVKSKLGKGSTFTLRFLRNKEDNA